MDFHPKETQIDTKEMRSKIQEINVGSKAIGFREAEICIASEEMKFGNKASGIAGWEMKFSSIAIRSDNKATKDSALFLCLFCSKRYPLPSALADGQQSSYCSINSSQYSTALLVCGITIVPPTRLATENISKTSAVVTPNSWHLPRWYFTQSSQRSTIEVASPSISFVLALSAPSW